MSVDGAGGVTAGNADLAALLDAELAQLAADAQALRALLVEGAVVTARVLPSNGLTDLLEIAGRRVAASLPPTLTPGDVVQVQVTGFDGDRILMQIVGDGTDATVEAGPPPPIAPPVAAFVAASIRPAPETLWIEPRAAAPAPASPPAAVSAMPAAPNAAPHAQAPPNAIPPARGGVGALFESVVGRAGVSPPGEGTSPGPPRAAAAPAPGSPAALERPVIAAPRAPGAPPARPVVIETETNPIEARLDAVRASAAQPPASGSPGARLAAPAAAPAAPPARFVPPPAIEAKPSPAAAPRAATAATAATYSEPAALLRALRLPVTPSNVASATMALQRPQALPAALSALEVALPPAGDDPNVATLRTLLAFVGRVDPRSPALATQVEAFVEHVVTGAEPKIATLLAARGAAGDASPIASALAAERGAALGVDLKQTMLALAADPATPAALAPSLAGAITALTAAQLSAAQSLAANPNGLAFTIPLATPSGPASAQITIARDAPDRGRAASANAANFRIAFVLETAHYGTVAIDLVTVGRDVTVDVRTESALAMRAFRDALDGLTARLESLRYRVASANASVGTTSTVTVDAPPAAAPDPDATVDRSA